MTLAEPIQPLVSVCVVTGARPRALDALLTSLRQQVDPPPFEVLVCGTADASVARQVHRHFPDARVGFGPAARPGGGRNDLLPAARGEWLYFLDDDVTVGSDGLRIIAELSRRHPEAGVFGGPNDTPARSSWFQQVQGAVLGSVAGSGPVRRRYGAHPAAPARERDLILCNLAIARAAMEPFDASAVCAEENGVLAELARKGVLMRYEPSLAVYHDRRPDLRTFTRQMHTYGRGRGRLIMRDVSTVRPTYLLAPALVVYVALLPVLAMLGALAVVPLLAYAAWILAGATKVTSSWKSGRPSTLALAAVLLVVVHFAYGTGVLRGLVRTPPAPRYTFRWLDGAPTEVTAGITAKHVSGG